MKYFYLLFISVWGFAQDFNQINSSNVLDYVSVSNNTFFSNTTITQLGNSNQSLIQMNRGIVDVLQFGNSNQFYFNGLDAQPALMNVNMYGSNNLIQVTGSNNISRGMSIEVLGHNRTIFITNQR